MKKSINKTQYRIVSILYNDRPSNLKKGYTVTQSREGNFLSIQNRHWIDQALKLSESFPEVFETNLVMMNLLIFKIKNIGPIPELLNYNSKHEE